MTTTMVSSLQLLSKPRSDNNDNNDDNKDAVIASVSKNDENHNVVFFAPVRVVVTAADKGGTHPHGHPPTSMPSCRRRGKDLLSLKPQSNSNDEDNDALITSVSKNNEDQVQLSSGLRVMVELPA